LAIELQTVRVRTGKSRPADYGVAVEMTKDESTIDHKQRQTDSDAWKRADAKGILLPMVEFPNPCTHELFERQVERDPNAVAIVCGNQSLTYRELNEKANQLGRRLRKAGVGPEALAGIALERTPELVIALLAVWKAGGAYLPLDPGYPRERLAFMVRDADACVLLTDTAHRNLFPGAQTVICLDSDRSAIAREDGANLARTAGPSNLAYVIYTSGSTGKPKGAMIQHDGLVNYLCWAKQAYGMTAGGSAPVHTSISFDLTVTSLLTPLIAGARVELLPEDVGAQSLLEALRRAKDWTLVKLTPTHLEVLREELRPAEVAGLTRTIVIGGESLFAESLQLWREFAPETRLINEYGPTEAVVGCCVYEVGEDDPSSGPIPIGRPIANTRLYVLDDALNPTDPGVAGELYIGGVGVARGYLNRPELTQERFLPDPFCTTTGARMYKTGDRCRYRSDGTLEFLGRVDDQVKIRGYRVELGEIEAALAAHAAVKSCAVVVRGDSVGNKQLVGYIVPHADQPPVVDTLQDFLKQTLPDFSTPSHFVVLDSLPLTPNAKIDRQALPAPTLSAEPRPGFVAAHTKTEKTLASIWSELLGLERVGIHDDFFDLGGHSLMAVRAVARIRDRFGVDLPLATLLQTSTIAGLAEILGNEQWAPSWSSLVPIRPEGSRAPLFLMHAHGGNVLEYRSLVSRLDVDQPVYAFQARGLDGQIITDPSLEEMAAAYIAELKRFQPEGPYFLGGFCLGGLLALEAAQQLASEGNHVGLVVMIQSMHPDVGRYKPSSTLLRRWWGRAAKRIDLELENLSNIGRTYVRERRRRMWDIARTRAVIALDRVRGQIPDDPSRRTPLYVSEALGIEHQRAMRKYEPRLYHGDVLLFRASKQLPDLNADEYLGWKRVLHGHLDVCEAPGHQQNLLMEPNVSYLAKELSVRLRAAQNRFSERRALSA
jgi:amino acid adenylation domain-containing protein